MTTINLFPITISVLFVGAICYVAKRSTRDASEQHDVIFLTSSTTIQIEFSPTAVAAQLLLLAVVCISVAHANEARPTVVFDEKGLTVRGADVTFELGGRLHADFGSGGSRAVNREFPDAAGFRRVWIEPKITIGETLIFNLQYDASSVAMPIKNLLFSYKGVPSFVFTGGNFKEPFSLEQLISSNDTTFMERSLADTFAPAHSTGFAIGTHGEKWTLSAGVFGGNLNETVAKGGLAGTARATWAPIVKSDEVLHLGLSGSYRSLDRRGPDVSFDTTPESFLFKTPLVDTGTIDGARSIGRLGLEVAWARGPFRLQGEYIATKVERDGDVNLSFRSAYIYAAWVLNGGAAKYSLKADTATDLGVFKRVEPSSSQRVSRGGVGVFELAARYSVIDLTSRDVRGGFQQGVTTGINWYPEPFIRVSANYVHAWADPTAATVTDRPAQADIGQVRLQIAF